MRHGQRASGQEIILDIDHQQGATRHRGEYSVANFLDRLTFLFPISHESILRVEDRAALMRTIMAAFHI
jgi:hypothetical protein